MLCLKEMIPSSGFFTNSTPKRSKRSHALYVSSTVMPIWPVQEINAAKNQHNLMSQKENKAMLRQHAYWILRHSGFRKMKLQLCISQSLCKKHTKSTWLRIAIMVAFKIRITFSTPVTGERQKLKIKTNINPRNMVALQKIAAK